MKPNNKLSIRRLRQVLVLSGLLCLGLSLSCPVSFAGIESDPSLTKLEKKFFFKEFPKDSISARLDRLEKTVFGETKEGTDEARLKGLVALVPNLDGNVTDDGDAPSTPVADTKGKQNRAYSQEESESPTPMQERSRQQTPRSDVAEKPLPGARYPQVDAMEQKLLGKAFDSEGISKRIERLETKVFGKPNASEDLSERVDRLKRATGVDIAKSPPAGSDWADDDEFPSGSGELTYTPEPAKTTPYTSPPGEDGRSFSGRDLRKDFQQAFGRPGNLTGNSGSYGMGGSSSRSSGGYTTSSGGYGFNPPKTAPNRSGVPMPAPDIVRSTSEVAPAPAMGLSQTVGLLEKEIFGKTYNGETLPDRLSRLENTVFPGQKAAATEPLPNRVHRLTDAVPVAPRQPQKLAQKDPDFADLDADMDGMPKPAPPRGGLAKVINGLGNLITGGGNSGFYPGAYPVNPGLNGLVRDPQTGLLWDRFSGNLIDPATGVIVGNKTQAMPGGGYPAYNSFGSGLSPLGSPYGTGYGGGMRFGFGGSGIRFGSGTGMGTGMIWP